MQSLKGHRGVGVTVSVYVASAPGPPDLQRMSFKRQKSSWSPGKTTSSCVNRLQRHAAVVAGLALMDVFVLLLLRGYSPSYSWRSSLVTQAFAGRERKSAKATFPTIQQCLNSDPARLLYSRLFIWIGFFSQPLKTNPPNHKDIIQPF